MRNEENKMYRKEIGNGLLVTNIQVSHAEKLEELQHIVFPNLAADELITAPHYLRHIELFPEGQFVITDKEKVVGMTSTMRCNFDFVNHQHTFKDTIAGGWMTNHNPLGEWLYGLDLGVHPDYRGKGLARILYRARQDIARQLGLKGQLTVGMMNGYGALSAQMSGEEYYNELLAGKRSDPTIGPQMKIGFVPMGLIREYLNDPTCGNYGVLIRLDVSKDV